MCVAALDGSSAASSGVDGAPPADSRLANSLQRGYFAQTFGQWEPIGSGGFGTVVKAWHLREEKWYAVKLINARVRASETAEDNHEAWSGPDVFGQLCALRSPHVVRYVRYWSELPGDLPCHAVERCPSPKVQTPPVALDYGGALPTQSVAASSTSALTESSTAASDCGFEWAAPSKVATRGAPSVRAISAVSTASSPNCMHKVVILEQMEYCEGVTLQSWLANPELRPGLSAASHDGVLELFSQVVKGLRDLHEAGIVHCDVKPANILVTKQDAQIKFFDFGSARVLSHGAQRCGRAPLKPNEQAGSCTTLGTPGYAPPEHCSFPALVPPRRQCSESSASQGSSILRSRLASPGSDMYSAGVVLLELLMVCVMGGTAWATAMERADALAHLRSGCEGALPLAVVRQPGIEGWLRQLVLRMVVWDAEVRPSAQEVLDELEAGLWLASRHNPNVGMSHSRAPQLAAMSCPFTAAHNPFIGFFLDHRHGGHL